LGANGMWMRDTANHTFRVSMGAKLILLAVLKFSTADPHGMGVEMEGGKPGWNDAMNGLPGIFGSSMPVMYEVHALLTFLRDTVKVVDRAVSMPVEVVALMGGVEDALALFTASPGGLQDEFFYWDRTSTAREAYRLATRVQFDGMMLDVEAAHLLSLLTSCLEKTQRGIDRALTGSLSPTYFSYEVTDYAVNNTTVTALAFQQHPLPLFLEGPVRHMKMLSDVDEKRAVYRLTRASELYDKGLQMYTLSASLKTLPPDVGRMVAFTEGWLENQSVWLHMSYKFYLELLRGGLYEEFFAEIATGMCAFMDPQVYGRSPLEACSFIVSSGDTLHPHIRPYNPHYNTLKPSLLIITHTNTQCNPHYNTNTHP